MKITILAVGKLKEKYLRDGVAEKEERIREKIREAVETKPMAHCFEHVESVTEHRRMAQIGG